MPSKISSAFHDRFSLTQCCPGKGSAWLRVTQPYKGYGLWNSLTQRCGCGSNWISAEKDMTHLVTAMPRKRLSLTERCSGLGSPWYSSVPDSKVFWMSPGQRRKVQKFEKSFSNAKWDWFSYFRLYTWLSGIVYHWKPFKIQDFFSAELQIWVWSDLSWPNQDLSNKGPDPDLDGLISDWAIREGETGHAGGKLSHLASVSQDFQPPVCHWKLR